MALGRRGVQPRRLPAEALKSGARANLSTKTAGIAARRRGRVLLEIANNGRGGPLFRITNAYTRSWGRGALAGSGSVGLHPRAEPGRDGEDKP